MDKNNSRMILVSNRLPMTAEKLPNGKFKINKSSGGLVAGLREIHNGVNCVWVGHCGIYSGDLGYADLKQQLAEERLITVDLSKDEYNAFYNGASNNEIWPLFHYFPNAIEAEPNNWPAYESVNQAFAKAILAIAKPGDQIWVHDYQLMFLPALLRNANPDLAIAYFHHIPFPSSELFRILQTRSSILTGLLGADLIGFHTYDYVHHFLTSVTRILGCSSHLDEILYQGRRIKVVAQPLGVDVKMIKKSSENQSEQEDVLKLAREVGNRTVLLGIDRLDYTKGIPERLLAFRQLLQQFPQHIGNVTFIQICVPTRSHITRYVELRSKVEQLVGQINGEFGAPGYTPVQYLYRSFSQDEIIAFYKLARVAVVTPLRDGLNLVCKEYVAARNDDDGVVILSEMAGAAAEMGEAILINPYDINQFSDALHRSLTMKAAERHARLVRLRQRIIEFDNMAWLRSFIKHWGEAVKRNHIHSIPLRSGVYANLINTVTQAKRCFIVVDHDFILNELKLPAHLELILMTHHTKDFCITHLSHLPIHLVAEHGAFIQFKGEKTWQVPWGLEEFALIAPDIIRLFEAYTPCVPGAFIERKQFSLAWNYQQTDPVFGAAQARDLSAAIAQLLENSLFGIYHHQQILEVRPLIANKSHALEQVLNHANYQPEDLLLTIGKDETDEDMYKCYPQQNMGIHVGAPNLFAKYHFSSLEDVQQFLLKISTPAIPLTRITHTQA